MTRSSAFFNLSIETSNMMPLMLQTSIAFCLGARNHHNSDNNNPFSLIREFCCYGIFEKYNIYKEVAETCHRIETLIIDGSNKDHESDHNQEEETKNLITLITNQKALRKLEIHNYYLSDSSIISMLGKHSQTLSHLVFHSVEFVSNGTDVVLLEGITDLENLQHLAFNSCKGIDEKILEPLYVKRIPKLTELDFRHTCPPSSSINILTCEYGQVLRKLYLGTLRYENDYSEVVLNITEKCAESLEEFSITYLDPLIETYILDPFTRLKKLCISGSFRYIDLSPFGSSIPESVESLTISVKWDDYLDSFKNFFAKCEAKLKYLLIERLLFVNNNHIDFIMKYHGNTLKTLKISAYIIKISEDVMKLAKRKIENVKIHTRTSCSLLYENFDILSERELTGIPWKENWYEDVDGLDEEGSLDYFDDDDFEYEYDYGHEYEDDFENDYGHEHDDDYYDYDYGIL